MNRKYSTINYDKLWSPSGDVFADAGGYALKYLSEKFPEKDILELIEYATDIYVNKWCGKLNPFFLNSTITQPAFKGDKKKSETQKYFLSLLNETATYIDGYCRILGIKTKLYPAGRNNSILSGSGTFANFHHGFEEGMMLSKEVLIRMHFLPLATEMLCGRLCVISSSNADISELFSYDCCERNFANIAHNTSEGVLANQSKNPSTAIFRFLDNLLLKVGQDCTGFLNLYHFTNFGATPDLQLYTLPFEAFDFYKETQRSVNKDTWQKFVAAYYRKPSEYKKADYDVSSLTFKVLEKKEERVVDESEFKYWTNTIYQNLINQKSILPHILKWSMDNFFDINLVKCYLYNILKMKKESIDKIMVLADFVVDNTKEVDMKKVLSKLNGIKSSFLLRKFLLKIVEKNFSDGNSDPIITVQDYTEYLFPEDNFWKEIRDVLLIAIYQRLHERNVKVENMEIEDDFADDEE